MPEESKKHKGKNDPKDQRRRRQGRQPAGPVEKKPEKQPERPVEKPSKGAEAEKPAFEPPGPEFYKNLKRETDEILKITEEANTKYKKKEIQSNWAKYEMPVETYEDIDEQENMGADYEKLIQAPATVGGHFQFKHEKSWDTDSGPSLYDKYFDINMDLLSLAVSTIPFYERNNIEQSMFNENDIVAMNHRATKFKQKYYNDKKYNTPELEAQDKILKGLTSNNEETMNDEGIEKLNIDDNALSENTCTVGKTNTNIDIMEKEQDKKENNTPVSSPLEDNISNVTDLVKEIKFETNTNTKSVLNNTVDDTETLFEANEISNKEAPNQKPDILLMKVELPAVNDAINIAETKLKTMPQNTPKNPVIESPEDLEKWLDDFLDD